MLGSFLLSCQHVRVCIKKTHRAASMLNTPSPLLYVHVDLITQENIQYPKDYGGIFTHSGLTFPYSNYYWFFFAWKTLWHSTVIMTYLYWMGTCLWHLCRCILKLTQIQEKNVIFSYIWMFLISSSFHSCELSNIFPSMGEKERKNWRDKVMRMKLGKFSCLWKGLC